MKVTTSGTQKEAQIVELAPTKKPDILHYDLDYDSTKPESTIRNFVSDIKGMLSRFEGNKARLFEIEDELQDIMHYIEISGKKKVPERLKLYAKLMELRQERRSCKNENDLLQPIYEYFHATEVLNKLSHIQGECSKAKTAIDGRTYLVRTNILDEWLEPDEPVESVKDIFDSDEFPDLNSAIEENADGTQTLVISLDQIPVTCKSTKDKPMSAFKQVWKA